jgi:hypothetical protein
MVSLKFGHLVHFVPRRCLKGVVEKSLFPSGSFDGVFGIVVVVDAGCAGPMGFFLFLNGRGFFPRQVAESCTRSQAGMLPIATCALGWNGVLITGFGSQASSGIECAVNCLAGTVKSWLITYGDLVQSAMVWFLARAPSSLGD